MKKKNWIFSFILAIVLPINANAIPSVNNAYLVDNDSKNQPEYVLYKAAYQKYKKGDFKNAKSDYLESLKANPIFFPSMIGLADIADRSGNKQKAEYYFKKAFKIKRNSSFLHSAYGKFLFKYNNIPAAKNEFEKALKINPKQYDAHTELAVIYLSRLNKPEKATKHYQAAIKSNPQNLSLFYGLSTAQAKTGNIKAAIATLKSVSKKLPANGLPWQIMGLHYVRARQYKEAIKVFKISLDKAPKLVKTHWALADTYVQAKQYDNALKEYQWIINNTEQKDIAYLKQGLVYHNQKNYTKAKKAYIQSTKSNPKLADPYNNIAYISLETRKNFNSGIKWAKKAVKLKPNSSVFTDTLGWLYYQVGDYHNARKQLQIAVKSKPVSAEANYHLARVYEKLNDKKSAAKYYSNAKKIDKHFKPPQ